MFLKVKSYIYENLLKVINHFKKKYKLEFNIIADENLIIPEYKIALLNKNKKIIKKIENIEKISSNNNLIKQNFINNKSNKNFRSRNKFKKHLRYRKNISPGKKLLNY